MSTIVHLGNWSSIIVYQLNGNWLLIISFLPHLKFEQSDFL
jgi:hypothetical protein